MRTISALLSAGLLMTSLSTAPPVHAEPQSSVQLVPINTKCTNKHGPQRIGWGTGEDVYVTAATWVRRNRGTMYACWGLYQVQEKRKKWDWYVGWLETVWYDNPANAFTDDDALLTQAIHSTLRAQDNTESATPTFTSSRSCSGPFSVGFGLGPFSLSASQELCNDFTMARKNFEPDSVMWQLGKVGKATHLQTMFAQKVYQRAGRPTFTFQVIFPQYRYRKDGEAYRRTYAGMKEIDRRIG